MDMRQMTCLIPVFLANLLLMVGCAGTSEMFVPLATAKVNPDTSSTAIFQAPIARLKFDLWRAARNQGWALVYPLKPDADGHYRAKSIVPDGRPLVVDAWPVPDDTTRFHVQIKIGRYGDVKRQALYLAQLKKVLAGKPMPKRGLNFSL